MNTCKSCGEHVEVPDGLEHTGFCNLCAQEDALRLEWLSENMRGQLRGTCYPEWKIVGTREDMECGGPMDQTLRQAIDEIRKDV